MRRGYTLIELLVVIGIIALLIAILLPVFASARSHSQGAACLSNLSQIGKAISLYAADYDDHIPFAPAAYTAEEETVEGIDIFSDPDMDYLARVTPPVQVALKPYETAVLVWQCPLDRIDPQLRSEKHYPATWYDLCGSSYTYDDTHALTGWTLSKYAKPAESPLFYDTGINHGGGPGGTGIEQVLFADSHVKAIKGQDLAEYIYEYLQE
jgi:prepilin-type N-terminal cleavage/methylation domain-containing protein